MQTAELDASKSELHVSVVSSQNRSGSISRNPEFKKRISKDKSIDRMDKSKALMGQIDMIRDISQTKMEAQHRSPKFNNETGQL